VVATSPRSTLPRSGYRRSDLVLWHGAQSLCTALGSYLGAERRDLRVDAAPAFDPGCVKTRYHAAKTRSRLRAVEHTFRATNREPPNGRLQPSCSSVTLHRLHWARCL